MKLRILSCAIFSCMLAACGGGSDSSDNNGPVTSQPAPTNPGTPGDGASDTISEFYNYQFNLPNIDGSEMESQKLLLASHKNKITDGILYADDNSAVDTEYAIEEDIVFPIYVTEQGVFPTDRTLTTLGYKLEKVLENTPDRFTSRPVTIPENNISNHRHIEWYDLSGKALTERTNIAVVKMYDDTETRVFFNIDNTTAADRKYYNEFASNFVGLQKARTFPNGSQCFRILAEHPEKEYIEFDPDIKAGYRTLDEWQAGERIGDLAKDILDESMSNLKYKKAEYKDEAMQYYKYFGAIEYQGEIYPSAFSEHGEHIDHADYIAQSKRVAVDSLKQEGASPLMIKWTEYNYDHLASACDGYNVTAANALNTAIKDATPR
ncbi:hypothetical protein J7649_08720 [Acinetobacter lwoffii]|jgi:hypothetical protein|uniref:hypothetical protein n=1 Tax=Acinetobacter lwoffii TaxID=28090 RepID=UPI001C5B8D17|nr:hypothetical protein [Acinetobacter lwoffii]QXX85497.1 hypothetical protein J7649_08720 [Acinetobacter lwoffii]